MISSEFPQKKKGALRLLKPNELETLRQMARGLAAQFGSNCEVVVHEISERSTSHSVVAIENGHVSGRKLGDGPSQVVLEQLGKDGRAPEDQLCYLTRTPDGKLLKSSSIYIRDESGRVCAIFCINFDISALAMAEQALAGLTSAHPAGGGDAPHHAQCQRPARRSHRAVRPPHRQAGRPDEQGGQGARHPFPQ